MCRVARSNPPPARASPPSSIDGASSASASAMVKRDERSLTKLLGRLETTCPRRRLRSRGSGVLCYGVTRYRIRQFCGSTVHGTCSTIGPQDPRQSVEGLRRSRGQSVGTIGCFRRLAGHICEWWRSRKHRFFSWVRESRELHGSAGSNCHR